MFFSFLLLFATDDPVNMPACSVMRNLCDVAPDVRGVYEQSSQDIREYFDKDAEALGNTVECCGKRPNEDLWREWANLIIEKNRLSVFCPEMMRWVLDECVSSVLGLAPMSSELFEEYKQGFDQRTQKSSIDFKELKEFEKEIQRKWKRQSSGSAS